MVRDLHREWQTAANLQYAAPTSILRTWAKNSEAWSFNSKSADSGHGRFGVGLPNLTLRIAIGQGSSTSSPWRICSDSNRPCPSFCMARRKRRSVRSNCRVDLGDWLFKIYSNAGAGCRRSLCSFAWLLMLNKAAMVTQICSSNPYVPVVLRPRQSEHPFDESWTFRSAIQGRVRCRLKYAPSGAANV